MASYILIAPLFAAYACAMGLIILLSRAGGNLSAPRSWLVAVFKWSSIGFFVGNSIYLVLTLLIVGVFDGAPTVAARIPQVLQVVGAAFLVVGPLVLSTIGVIGGAVVGYRRAVGRAA